jgi:4-hydroxy-tetrahydrodipicolinate reductase
VSRVAIIRSANVRSIGPSDFAHLGFGMEGDLFARRWLAGDIDGHVGFPESIAALAEHVGLTLDRITDALEPTLAVQPLDLGHRRVEIGEVVGITQRAQGLIQRQVVVDFTLEMFLDPAGYGREPREEIVIEGGRAFSVKLSPAAPPTAGAAAMMLHAALALPAAPFGFVSLLDLPLGGRRTLSGYRETAARRSSAALEIDLAST